MKSGKNLYRPIGVLFLTLVLDSPFIAFNTYAQTKTAYQSAVAGGTTNVTSTNGKVQLVGVVGQPLVSSASVSGFYTVAYLLTADIDSIPPVISIAFGKQVTKGTSQALSPIITDNYFNQIADAKIYFRPIGSKVFTSKDLIRSGTTTSYSTSLEADKFDAMGVEFYLTAKDVNNNSQRYPASGGLYIYSADKATIPSTLLSFGDQKKNYRIVSVPYSFSENVSTLLEEFGANDPTQWRLITYAGGDSYLEYPSDFSTLERARGYWLIARQSKELILGEGVQAPENNQANLYEMTLQPGWNQIGNPYTLPVSWENVRTYNTLALVGKLKLYDGSASEPYKNGDDFLPYQGGFAYLDGTSPLKIKIPFTGQTSGGRKGQEPRAGGWQLPIEITSGDITNTMGGIGMNPDALVTKDRFDDHNPPQFLDYTEINFSHPEHPLKSFCFDIVPEQEEYVWKFTTASSLSGVTQLNWNNQTELAGKELYLFDEAEGKIVDMMSEDCYTTTADNSGFKIYYGHNVKENIRPEEVRLGRAYPNPFYEEVNVSFALPGVAESYSVSVDIFNPQGQKVKTIVNDDFNSGFHKVTWHGEDTESQRCAPGLYFYKLRVTKDDKHQVLTERILLTR